MALILLMRVLLNNLLVWLKRMELFTTTRVIWSQRTAQVAGLVFWSIFLVLIWARQLGSDAFLISSGHKKTANFISGGFLLPELR